MSSMSIEEFVCGAVDLHAIVTDLLVRVDAQLIDEEKSNLIREAVNNSRTPQDSIQLLYGIILYGYFHMSPVVKSFADDEHEEVRSKLRSK